jgi:hypothetical protein
VDEPTPAPAWDGRGRGLIGMSWAGTVAYTLVALLATVTAGAVQVPLIVVSVTAFVVGAGAFLAAYAIAISRSRYDAIGMGGLFFLSGGVAPGQVQRLLVGSLAAQVLVAVVSSSIGLFVVPAGADNPLAYGVLTPLYGLGLAGLWGARHGMFPARRPSGGREPEGSGRVAGEREGPG